MSQILILAILLSGLSKADDLENARRFLRDKNYPEMLREIERALHESPQDPELQYQAGEILREMGAVRAAQLSELAPDSAEAHELLGRSFEVRGELDAALHEYRAALSKNALTPGVHFLIGNVRWKQRDLEAAKVEFESELRIGPNHRLANLRLGQTLLAMNQPFVATGHLRSAVLADGSSMEAHRELGKAYRALGRNSEALTEFKVVAAALPNDGFVHAQLASVYRALGDKGSATEEMEKHRRLLAKKAEAARKQSLSNAR